MRAHLWEPELGFRGFFWQRVFRDVGIIGAAGVGGGSIVWGGVLLKPESSVFADPAWGDGEPDWESALSRHYDEAGRMLGRTANPFTGPMDDHLRATAAEVGGDETFGPVPLAIHFGDPGETVPDPYFGGEGPERTGCHLCGGCLAGCPYGAKNSLDKNYLYLAEKLGARILAERRVVSIAPLPGGGYELKSRHPWRRRESPSPLRAERVVLAAGVLGTLELLFRCRDETRHARLDFAAARPEGANQLRGGDRGPRRRTRGRSEQGAGNLDRLSSRFAYPRDPEPLRRRRQDAPLADRASDRRLTTGPEGAGHPCHRFCAIRFATSVR